MLSDGTQADAGQTAALYSAYHARVQPAAEGYRQTMLTANGVPEGKNFFISFRE